MDDNKFPPLPVPGFTELSANTVTRYYTANQMRAYAEQYHREACAKQAGAEPVAWWYTLDYKGERLDALVSAYQHNMAEGLSPFGREGIDYVKGGVVKEFGLYLSPQPAASDGRVALPTNAEQARAMAILGTNWLKEHAPDELTNPVSDGRVAAASKV